ncbi:hypothetical protein CYMTET_17763 [Cymbomonas tetramitiformis]|uniref:glutathione gamma-glutamylcysteinyltransferase n=1 Tax=Cymbomonas tetramitiformis TaxID=36881 RepID=A0AAE0G9H0_9CHLO|nr:hypothetical protein CYMTET_17763 [Cymbomonas tetramitiformis]
MSVNEQVRSFYRRPLPSPPAIAFSSPEGKAIFSEALAEGGMGGYFRLAEQFVTQEEPAFCGLASLTMVLNALEIDPRRTWKGAWRWFDTKMLDCCEPLDKIAKEGIVLDKLSCLAQCNGAQVRLNRPPSMEPSQDLKEGKSQDVTLQQFRTDIESACCSSGPPVIVSYSRKEFEQTGDGHFSPVGGYNRERDLVLIMDVARFKYPPHWVSLEKMWTAMRRLDNATGLPRGYLTVSLSADTGRGRMLTLSAQRRLYFEHLNFFTGGGLREAIAKSAATHSSEPQDEAIERTLDQIVQARSGLFGSSPMPSSAVFDVYPEVPWERVESGCAELGCGTVCGTERSPNAAYVHQQVRALPLPPTLTP